MKTVLIVDDEADLRDSLQYILNLNSFNVLVAESGNQAIKLLSSGAHKIDLILSDINMPDGDGFELLAKVNELPQKIPMILMTGRTQIQAPKEAFGLLLKPFSFDNLIELVNSGLHLQKNASAETSNSSL